MVAKCKMMSLRLFASLPNAETTPIGAYLKLEESCRNEWETEELSIIAKGHVL